MQINYKYDTEITVSEIRGYMNVSYAFSGDRTNF